MKFFTYATKWSMDKEGVCARVCVSICVLSCNAIFLHWEISFQTVLSGCVHHFITEHTFFPYTSSIVLPHKDAFGQW